MPHMLVVCPKYFGSCFRMITYVFNIHEVYFGGEFTLGVLARSEKLHIRVILLVESIIVDPKSLHYL